MKYLIFASILCLVGADLVKRATPAVDKSVRAFSKGSKSTGSLSKAFGVNEKWLDDAGNDIQSELGKHLTEAFNDLLEKIKQQVDHGKEVAQELLEKAKEIREKLKEMGIDADNKAREVLQKIREKAKETLRMLLDKLGLGKRNLDDQLDRVARSKFSELIELVIDSVTTDENIKKIRDYINSIDSDTELARELKHLVDKLSHEQLKEIVRSSLDHRVESQSAIARVETWDKIKEWFKDIKIEVKSGEHTKKFDEWVKNTWDKGIDKLRKKYGAVKAIAMEFISHGKEVSVEEAREALEFFRPHKENMGNLWDQLVEVVKQAIGKF